VARRMSWTTNQWLKLIFAAGVLNLLLALIGIGLWLYEAG
jgi:hypothetical protein